jgi:hypothetical protein
MDIDELKGIEVDRITVKRIVCIKHGLRWETEWLQCDDKPKPNAYGLYDLYELYVWLGY